MGLIPQWTLWAQKDNKAKKKKPCKTDFTQKWTITNMKLSLEPYFSKFMLNLLSVQPDLVLEMRNMLLDYIFLFQIYLVGVWSSKDLKRFSVDLVVLFVQQEFLLRNRPFIHMLTITWKTLLYWCYYSVIFLYIFSSKLNAISDKIFPRRTSLNC